MQIVTDSGVNLSLSPEEIKEYKIQIVPLRVTLNEKTYREGLDISNADFYQLLSESNQIPQTSQPSPGEFAELYRNLAQEDPEILSIHMSSGLSGTYQSALLGAAQVPGSPNHTY